MYLARTALIGDTFQIELEFRNVGFSFCSLLGFVRDDCLTRVSRGAQAHV